MRQHSVKSHIPRKKQLVSHPLFFMIEEEECDFHTTTLKYVSHRFEGFYSFHKDKQSVKNNCENKTLLVPALQTQTH